MSVSKKAQPCSLFSGTYKVSIITVVYNGENTIEDAIMSVASQNYSNIEHIIIDGLSTDNTLERIEKHLDKVAYYISEKDKGIYDAIDKGLIIATGEIIGILNADDVYYDSYCISAVVEEFKSKKVEVVCGDLVYVDSGKMDRIVRYYSSKGVAPKMFEFGHMPPHPATFISRYCYEQYGLYKVDYKISADYELLARLLRCHGVSYSCLQKVIVKMKTGGVSTKNLKSNLILNKEVLRACRENDISGNWLKICLKYFFKIKQLFERPCIDGDSECPKR